MAYLGVTPTQEFSSVAKQSVTGDGSVSYTLNKGVSDANDLAVFVNDVRQEPGVAYTASGNTITFTANLESTDDCYILHIGRTFSSAESPGIEDKATQKVLTITTDGHLVPTANVTYDLGTSDLRFRDIYLSGSSINLGDHSITANSTHISMGNVVTTGVMTGNGALITSLNASELTSGTIPLARLPDDITIVNDLTIGGDFIVNGNTTTIAANELKVEDSLIQLASNNEISDTVDIGFVGHYYDGSTQVHTGFFRDASDEQYYLFKGYEDADFDTDTPPATIDRTANTFALADLNIGNFTSIGIDDNATSTAITIDSGQQVGIGTASPGYKLDVNGTLRGAGLASVHSGAAEAQVQFVNSNRFIYHFLSADGSLSGTYDSTGTKFIEAYDYTNNVKKWYTAGSERMRIDAGGSVLIGKTTPIDLHNTWNHLIIGEKGAIISQNGAGGIDGISIADNAYIDTDTGNYAYQISAAASKITQTGGVITFANAGSGSAGAALSLTERMRISSSGNVAIGDDDAQYKLDVSTSNLNSPIFRIGYNSRTWAGGELRMGQLNAADGYSSYLQGYEPVGNSPVRAIALNPYGGNVGIGTTTPSERLELTRTAGKIGWGMNGNYGARIGYFDDGGGVHGFHIDTKHIGTTTSESRFIVRADSGRVGIGTKNPATPLDVEGPINSAAYPYVVTVSDTAAYNVSDNGGGIGFAYKFDAAGNLAAGPIIQGIKENNNPGVYGSALRFLTRAHGSNPAECMRIDSSGRVGIGNPSPSYKLEVSGPGSVLARLSATDSAQAYMAFTNSTTGGGLFADGSIVGLDSDESAVFWNFEATPMRFGTSGIERMRITSSGNVEIGGNQVWHAGNDGSGSGLDADTLDGRQATGFFKVNGGSITGGTGTEGSLETGNYNVTEVGYSTQLIHFAGVGGSSPTLQLYAQYADELYFRVARDSATNWDSVSRYAKRILHTGDRDLVLSNGAGGSFGNRLMIGATSTAQTLQDGNLRPTAYLSGAYPVITLNHTSTTNDNHGPTIQFTHNGYNSNRQWLIGTDGQGQRLDFGVSGGTAGTNSTLNPHNGISGYSGVTIMRLFQNGVLIGSTGVYPNEVTSTSYTLDVRGNGTVTGSFSKGSGSFKIDHPLESKSDTHDLVHSFIEGPQADLIYRGKVNLVDGSATVNIDTAAGMTEGTFVILNREVQCFTTNESDWDAVKGSVSGNILTIECQNTSSSATVSWMVIGERQDAHMYDTEWTDEDGRVIVEPLKQSTESTANTA